MTSVAEKISPPNGEQNSKLPCPYCSHDFTADDIDAHIQQCLKDRKGTKNASSASSLPSKEPSLRNFPGNSNETSAPKVWQGIPPLPEAPVFRPTEEEFKDPMKYISSISVEAKKWGICKIIPPSDKWLAGKPASKVMNSKTFIFPTKLQNIHQLQSRSGPAPTRFLQELEAFLARKGTPLHPLPRLEGKPLDLARLYSAVTARGGLQVVIQQDLWEGVAEELRLPHSSGGMGALSYVLRQNYFKYLYAYELNNKARKQHQMNMDTSQETEEFGYHDGRMFTLNSFKKMATAFSKKWYPGGPPSFSEVEEAYWKIVELGEEEVQAHYGSDLDVASHGSGFPMDPDDLRYASGWNLNLFPKLPGSLLSHLEESTPGVSQPMMYIGMLFSTFCWHTEDNELYSINYLHDGAFKTWYGVPESHYEAFEKTMRETVPELFRAQPDLLSLLITMISPRVVKEANIPICTTVQQPGEFMITFPKAYHSGFSHGFNIAESTNFALPDWLPYGRESVERYRTRGRASVLSFEKLLCNAALRPHSEEVAERLREELPLMRQTEVFLREKVLLKEGTWKSVHFGSFDAKDTSVRECSVCKHDCYLSAIVCPCSPDRVVCLRHSLQLCSCPAGRRSLVFRWRICDLDVLLARVGCPSPPFSSLLSPPHVSRRATLGSGKEGIHRAKQHYTSVESLSTHRSSSVGLSPVKVEHKVVSKEDSMEEDSKEEKEHSADNSPVRSKEDSKEEGSSEETSPSLQVKQRLARVGGLRCLPGVQYGDPKEEVNEGLCVVESILEDRSQGGVQEFLLKWEGYPASESTWIKASDFHCPGLVEAFLQRSKRAAPQTSIKRSSRTTKGKRPRVRYDF